MPKPYHNVVLLCHSKELLRVVRSYQLFDIFHSIKKDRSSTIALTDHDLSIKCSVRWEHTYLWWIRIQSYPRYHHTTHIIYFCYKLNRFLVMLMKYQVIILLKNIFDLISLLQWFFENTVKIQIHKTPNLYTWHVETKMYQQIYRDIAVSKYQGAISRCQEEEKNHIYM